MIHSGSWSRHIARNHHRWISGLWERKEYVRLLWLGKDIGNFEYGNYIFYYAAQALAGNPPSEPFDPSWTGPHRDVDRVLTPLLNAGWPDPLPDEPVAGLAPEVDLLKDPAVTSDDESRCGICWEVLTEDVNWIYLHDDKHCFCMDCLDQLIASRMRQRVGLNRQGNLAFLECPMCRTQVDMDLVSCLMDSVLLGRKNTANVQTVRRALGAPASEAMEFIAESPDTPIQRRLQSSGWISRTTATRPTTTRTTVTIDLSHLDNDEF